MESPLDTPEMRDVPYDVPDGEATLLRLAKLPRADYDRCRKDEADRLGLRLRTLDDEVRARRPTKADSVPKGNAVEFRDVEPWAEPVNGAELVNAILATLTLYVVAPHNALLACALFVLHTYAFNLGDISPILFITGPTKRCGKSRLLAVLARLVNRALAVSSASAAGIYRTIELFQPTLLIDEVDAFMSENEQLRGLVNSGHTRDAAFHLGCAPNGDDYLPVRWSTWAPKIFAGIGGLADTIEDRSIRIQMRRRRKDEVVPRLRHGTQFEELRRKCARFVLDNAEAIRAADPAVPEALNDRAADNWTPLLALADLAGGDWPEKARQAALELSGEDKDDALSVQLLADIRDTYQREGIDRLSSVELCEKLAAMVEGPWAEYGKRREQISPSQLARLLKPFGVASRNLKQPILTSIDVQVRKGYLLDDFSDAFARYLPSNGDSSRYPATEPVNKGENPPFATATDGAGSGSQNTQSPNKDGAGSGVADEKPRETGKTGKEGEPGREPGADYV